MKLPIIILNKPQMGENIGAAARIMSNFGLSDLRIISPRDGWPNQKAIDMAAHGSGVLENAKIFESLSNAITDINLLFATASSDRFIVKDVIAPKEMLIHGLYSDNQVGFLFGCERTGLENDEISKADVLVKIPVSEQNPSINLAQAVGILCYEWSRNYDDAKPPEFKLLANKSQTEAFFEFLEINLLEKGYFRSPKMRPTIMRNFRNFILRAKPTEQDIRTLWGMFKKF